jgi:hypothetical protein
LKERLAHAPRRYFTQAAAAVCICVLSALGFDSPVRAEEQVLVLVVGSSDDAVVLAIVDELSALGLDSEIVPDLATGSDVRALRALARSRSSALLISASRIEGDIDVVLVDRITGKVTVRSLPADGDDPQSARRIALRTIDLLRVSLSELEDGEPPEAELAASEVARELGSPPRTWWLGIGAGLSGSVGGLDPWSALALWGRLKSLSPLSLALRVSLPVTVPTVQAEAGVADVRPWEIAFDARLRATVGPVGLEGGVAASLWLVSMQGRALAPYVGRDIVVPALLGSIVAGASVDLTSELRLRLDGAVGVSLPEVGVQLGEERRATLGVPAMSATVGIELGLGP